MSTPVATANSILALIYRATAWADIAENDSTSPATNLEVSLHSAAPASDVQTSNELANGQGRFTISRSGTGWSVPSGGSLSNLVAIEFTEATSGPNTATHIAVGANGKIIHYGALTTPRTVDAGITPRLAVAALVSSIT